MNDKPKVLIVSPHKVGLTETFIRAHIEQLDAEVYHLYGWELDFKMEDDTPLKDYYRSKTGLWQKLMSLIPHYWYFRLKQKEQKALAKPALIERYIRDHQIDLVLAEYGTAGSWMAPICKRLALPLLVHFHGFDASRYDILERYRKDYQLMFQVAQKIIVVSKAMAKALEQQGCPKDKLVLNTYGPHPDYNKVTADYESNYLIAVGRHTYKKAPYLTILAFQKVLQEFPNLKLKMIGDGELFDVSKNLIKSLGLEDKILLLGGLERSEIIKHLQTAFAYVQHSVVAYNGDSEGTPVGIIEAMAAGLPIVSTKHAGIPDVVQHEETGFLVEENDIDAMAKYICSLVRNRNEAKTKGAKARTRIANHFTIEKHLYVINKIIADSIKKS